MPTLKVGMTHTKPLPLFSIAIYNIAPMLRFEWDARKAE